MTDRNRKVLLVVYQTMTGGSEQMAHAAARGAREQDVDVRVLRAVDTSADDVLNADGYLFVTPENLASMAGLMKDFFDRTYYAALERIEGRPYAALVCAGSDGTNAVRQIERICTGWRLRSVAEPVIVCTHAQTKEAILAPKTLDEGDLQRCADTGAALAAGLELGIF